MLFTFLSLQISKFEVTNPAGNFMLALRTARWREDGLVPLMLSAQNRRWGKPSIFFLVIGMLDHEYLRRYEVSYLIIERSVWNGKK